MSAVEQAPEDVQEEPEPYLFRITRDGKAGPVLYELDLSFPEDPLLAEAGEKPLAGKIDAIFLIHDEEAGELEEYEVHGDGPGTCTRVIKKACVRELWLASPAWCQGRLAGLDEDATDRGHRLVCVDGMVYRVGKAYPPDPHITPRVHRPVRGEVKAIRRIGDAGLDITEEWEVHIEPYAGSPAAKQGLWFLERVKVMMGVLPFVVEAVMEVDAAWLAERREFLEETEDEEDDLDISPPTAPTGAAPTTPAPPEPPS